MSGVRARKAAEIFRNSGYDDIRVYGGSFQANN
jgi:rhodanese-related sulfurtransferase